MSRRTDRANAKYVGKPPHYDAPARSAVALVEDEGLGADALAQGTLAGNLAFNGITYFPDFTGWRVELGDRTTPIKYTDGTDTAFSVDALGTVQITVTSGKTLVITAGGTGAIVFDSDGTAHFWRPFYFDGFLSPSQITSNQNDYNPTNFATANSVRLTSDASRDITGILGANGGRLLTLHNVGSNNIVLKDESVSSSSANRFALSGDLTVLPDTSVLLQYDYTSSRWRVAGTSAPISGSAGGDLTGTYPNPKVSFVALAKWGTE